MRVNTSKILVLIKQKEQEYRKLLEAEDPVLLDRAFSFLEYRRDLVDHNVNIPFNESLQKLDRGTQRIFELMEQYAQELKKIFVENGGVLTHITDISPENMKDRRIKKSFNRANNYETEFGNWLFASSASIDGENLYIARKKEGMICLTDTVYVFGGDNFYVEPDENGNNHMYLKESNYIYFIEPTNFVPVVILKRDKDGKPYFEFSEEWISEEEVSIDNPDEVLDIEEVTEITDLLYTYQIFCDVKMQGLARRIIRTQSVKRGMELLNEYTDSNDLLYMNGIAEINVSPMMKNAYFEEWKKRILLEIKYHFEGEVEFDLFKRIENGELSSEIAKEEKELELEKRIQEYISKNGGIEHIVNARIAVLNAFDNVINTYRRLKEVPYFQKREELESVLREFYNSIKTNYSTVDCFWEYSQYINMIREVARLENAYPFIEEIVHPQSEKEPEKTLDCFVRLVRDSVCKEKDGYSFYNKCVECQKELNILINGQEGILNKSLDTQYNMGLPSFQHSFNLVKLDGRFFIIDPTYVQFCDISYTTDVLGVPGLSAGNPGMYLMQDKTKLEFLRNLIRNGYFEATEENVKMYFDSFVLANRNIEFYRNHGGASTMSTDISAREYIRAILEGKKVSFGNPKELGSAQDIGEHKEFFE